MFVYVDVSLISIDTAAFPLLNVVTLTAATVVENIINNTSASAEKVLFRLYILAI